MTLIGYHASHEQFAPEDLLAYVGAAEAAGFQAVMSSDHFHPWSRRQGQSGFNWAWLGAAMQATSLPFGTFCVPGGWRYHPAIVAQATATLARLFPGRLQWISPGSGELLNEGITGEPWPDKAERNARLETAVRMIRSLWRGETVTAGPPVPTTQATLYTRPTEPVPMLAPVLTPESARWAGEWADGMITINQSPDMLRGLIAAFRSGGGEGKPIALQVHLSWANTDEQALAAAFDQWRSNAVTPVLSENLRTPEAYEEATSDLGADDMHDHVRISSDPARHTAWIGEDIEMGFNEIYLHNVGRNQREFIDVFGERVLSALPKIGGGAA